MEFKVLSTRPSTTDLLPPGKAFYNYVENHFCNKALINAKGLTDAEFEVQKDQFINSADAALLLHAQAIRGQNPIIVTEEMPGSNDGKPFKKIPANCQVIGIPCCTLPVFLKNHLKINLGRPDEAPTLF